jgi:hypothetical protein
MEREELEGFEMKQSKLERSVVKNLANGGGGDRPLMRLNCEQALRVGDSLVDRSHQQVDFWIHAWIEFVDVRKGGKSVRAALEARFDQFGARPEPWFRNAWLAARSVGSNSKGRHHLYVLVCAGYGPDGKGLGLYVGETRRRPDVRFEQHASGQSERYAARPFRHDCGGTRRRPIAVLGSFCGHLGFPTKANAKEIEFSLVEAIRSADVPRDRVGGPRVPPRGQSADLVISNGDTAQVSA